MKHKLKKRYKILLGLFAIWLLGMLIPQNLKMPVKGASQADYNSESFWYYPWGKSVTHKGVDIFAKEGTELQAATSGLVLYSGEIRMGGKVILILGPKWRLHYYAHLADIDEKLGVFISGGKKIGTVGSTGNAAGKAPHLHYSIFTLTPYPWRIDSAPQGWRKMFYLNPIDYLSSKP